MTSLCEKILRSTFEYRDFLLMVYISETENRSFAITWTRFALATIQNIDIDLLESTCIDLHKFILIA